MRKSKNNGTRTRAIRRADGRGATKRVIDILGSFNHNSPGATAKTLAVQTGIPESTLFRLLQPLLKSGLLSHDPDTGLYRPGLKLLELGDIASRQLRVHDMIQPALDELQRKTDETVSFSIWRGGTTRTCIAAAHSTHSLRETVDVGGTYPIWLGSAGKAIAAFLPESVQQQVAQHAFADSAARKKYLTVLTQIQSDGIAESVGERVPGVMAVSAPVFASSGAIQGSLSISGPEFRVRPRVEEYRKLVRQFAEQLAGILGGRTPKKQSKGS